MDDCSIYKFDNIITLIINMSILNVGSTFEKSIKPIKVQATCEFVLHILINVTIEVL